MTNIRCCVLLECCVLVSHYWSVVFRCLTHLQQWFLLPAQVSVSATCSAKKLFTHLCFFFFKMVFFQKYIFKRCISSILATFSTQNCLSICFCFLDIYLQFQFLPTVLIIASNCGLLSLLSDDIGNSIRSEYERKANLVLYYFWLLIRAIGHVVFLATLAVISNRTKWSSC